MTKRFLNVACQFPSLDEKRMSEAVSMTTCTQICQVVSRVHWRKVIQEMFGFFYT